MTEDRARQMRQQINEDAIAFDAARKADDWDAADRLWREMVRCIDDLIRRSTRETILLDGLQSELLLYRPDPSAEPPAPRLAEYDYAYTGKSPWICAAKVRREAVYIQALAGLGYYQECWTLEKTTACGKNVSFPHNERDTSPGWPRLRQLCPDCIRALAMKTRDIQGEFAFQAAERKGA